MSSDYEARWYMPKTRTAPDVSQELAAVDLVEVFGVRFAAALESVVAATDMGKETADRLRRLRGVL